MSRNGKLATDLVQKLERDIVTGVLKPGDKLIVEGLVNLKPGTVVRPGAPQQITAQQQGAKPGAGQAAGQPAQGEAN